LPASEGLLTAILAVQAEAPTLPKDKINPHFRSSYTPLDTIVERIGPILNKHGLVWLTMPCRDDSGEPALKYRLAHAGTGEVIEDTMPLLLSKADAQGMGSAITYARRYSLCAVLNLVADDDDDGNAARPSGASSAPSTSPSATAAATPEQLKYLKSLVTKEKPSEETLRLMLADVDADGVDPTKAGWSKALKKDQASRMIERFKSGTLPTGKSDIPNDLEPPPEPVAAGEVPWSDES
jgi:hypothetical protein